MDEATAARAFELFFTTRSGQGGSGVGLALCREIVEQLGGRIEMRSAARKGTRMVVRLPRSDLEAWVRPISAAIDRNKPDPADHSH